MEVSNTCHSEALCAEESHTHNTEHNPTGYAIPHFIRNDTAGVSFVILSATKNCHPPSWRFVILKPKAEESHYNKSRVPPDS